MSKYLPILPPAWAPFLGDVWSQLKLDHTGELMRTDLAPPTEQWFRILKLLTPAEIKVVILGQDPYHGEGQAEGLSFSVPFDQKIPPSLKNIQKELTTDEQVAPVDHGHLIEWVDQGVMLLNASLTVPLGEPGAQLTVWEGFTDEILRVLDKQDQGIVFMLWGAFAQSKAPLLDREKHLVLTAAHPSPLSAYRGFFGCRHFSQANDWLKSKGRTAINWQLSPINRSLF
ncbi:uracil-DNA glycosylase [uncultured Umboniibacter sp.]|uniref:uracil-DNA glycosylase n=1 Tax=uncultured Umboniibacter sp. TaxID=1798917 RepID=UPI00262FB701|nr:uracil-DNA glycosylase [uncultured Umboniibacter sp.]